MPRPRPFVSLVAAVGLLLTSVPLHSQDDNKDFNRSIAARETTCSESLAPGRMRYPFTVTGYPFSVIRLKRAIAASGRDATEAVKVAVFDNPFFGYRYGEDASGDPQVRGSRNFPDPFFRNGKYYLDDTPIAPLELAPAINPETRHGTSIAGIILGGKYDDDVEPDDDDGVSLARPSVRALLAYGAPPQPGAQPAPRGPQKSWLQLGFVAMNYAGSGGPSSDPIDTLGNYFRNNRTKVDIINMSFGQVVRGNELLRFADEVQNVLIVAAAGNSKREVQGENLRVKPISAQDPKGILIAVASHDADGALSSFSNFGKDITISAPGCGIKSWLDGESSARALFGTSMSAAVVSFGAALLKAHWPEASSPTYLRNRLISAARFEPALSKCERTRVATECVQNGSMLDIEAALLINKDFIEYRDCSGNEKTPAQCPRKLAIGTVDPTPEPTPGFLGTCMAEDFLGSKPIYKKRLGLTFNGAIKAIEPDTKDNTKFLILYEPGPSVGDEKLSKASCTRTAALGETITFQAEGIQLDGSTAPEATLFIKSEDLIRIVARAEKR